jgi:protoheme IX farnesyltransferase
LARTRLGLADRLRAYVELSKPGVTRMVLVTTGLGVVAAPGAFRFADLLAAVFGTALVVVGANALNMFIERDSDRFMTRTAKRPLPSGRLAPEAALAFGCLTSIVGLFCLAFFSSSLAFSLAALALLSYVLLYTPLKRVSSLSLVVGAVPGALPPAIGYAAVTGTVDGVGLWLFLILLVWQVPHFLAISIYRQSEYERAGLRVLPAECGVPFAKLTAFAMALVLLYTTMIPYAAGLAPPSYGIVAGVSGVCFAAWAARGMASGAGDRWARSLFFGSMPHLVLVMSALVMTTV